MDFWQTFWATMWGALGGAVVAALAAWLFSLDLRRREREDRKQEREQDRLDREAERAQAHEDRQSELQAEREIRRTEREQDQKARADERQEERDHQYAMTMQRQWLVLEDAITRFSWADPKEKLAQFASFSATFTLTGATAKGDDRQVFDTLADLFTIGEMEGEVAIGISTILAVFARDGMPASFAIQQIQEVAKERDAAALARENGAEAAG